jgi:hypothetical protein
MTDIFLGVIAVSVLVMAAIQVAAIVMAARVARRVDRAADRMETGVDTFLNRLHGLTDDATRAASVFSGILGMFRKSRAADARKSPAAADADDPMSVG